MGPGALFWRVEVPLALRTVLAGVRVSAVYTLGTATVAPIIGAAIAGPIYRMVAGDGETK